MNKVILFPAGAFVLSLVATTGYLVKAYVPPVVVGADSTRAGTDGPRADSIRAASAGAEIAPADSASPPDSTARAAGPPGAAPPAEEARPRRQGPAPVDPVAKAAAFKQVARVLSAMKPAEAAQVIGLLSDDEVEGILRAVGPRQAADFLINIPRERAASLSRRLLRPKEESR